MTTDLPLARSLATPKVEPPGGPSTGDGQASRDSHLMTAVPGSDLPPAMEATTPTATSPGGSDSGDGHSPRDSQPVPAVPGPDRPPAVGRSAPNRLTPGGLNVGNGHRGVDAHFKSAVPDPNPGSADQMAADAHSACVGATGQTPEPGHFSLDTQAENAGLGPILASPLLGICAEQVDDLERTRIATDNRLRSLTTVYGLTVDLPEVATVAALASALADLERGAVKNLERVMRAHPLGPQIGGTVGVGYKQAARLLAVIGDPYWNGLANRPRRGPDELKAYCGYHTVNGQAPRRRKGEQGNWNEKARMRTHLIAAQTIRYRHSPYREVYDETRAKYADRGLTPAQEHARALRKVAQELLKDLWRAAKRIHDQQAAAIGAATPIHRPPLPAQASGGSSQ